jgi:hypothetical protein
MLKRFIEWAKHFFTTPFDDDDLIVVPVAKWHEQLACVELLRYENACLFEQQRQAHVAHVRLVERNASLEQENRALTQLLAARGLGPMAKKMGDA